MRRAISPQPGIVAAKARTCPAHAAAKARSPISRAIAADRARHILRRHQQAVRGIDHVFGEAAEPAGQDRPAVRDGQAEHAAGLDFPIREGRHDPGAEQRTHLVVGHEARLQSQPIGHPAPPRQRGQRRGIHIGLADHAQPRLRAQLRREARERLDQQVGALVRLDLAEQQEGQFAPHRIGRRQRRRLAERAVRQHRDARLRVALFHQPRPALLGMHDHPVEAREGGKAAHALQGRGGIAVERVGVVNGQHQRRDAAQPGQEMPVDQRQRQPLEMDHVRAIDREPLPQPLHRAHMIQSLEPEPGRPRQRRAEAAAGHAVEDRRQDRGLRAVVLRPGSAAVQRDRVSLAHQPGGQGGVVGQREQRRIDQRHAHVRRPWPRRGPRRQRGRRR